MEKEKIDLEFAEALKRADKNIHEYLVLEPAWYFKPYCLNDLDAISSTYKEKLSNQKNKMGLHPTSIEKSNLAQA